MNSLPAGRRRTLLTAFFLVPLLTAWTAASAQTASKASVSDLCWQCHKKLKESLSQGYPHAPFRQVQCAACHEMHASKHEGLTKNDRNSLCLGCHEGIKTAMKKGRAHGALTSGVCTDCHEAHAAEYKKLLAKTEKSLCVKCHEDLKEQLKKKHVHAPFKEGKCSACHDPHASPGDDLLRASARSICQQCHAPRCRVGDTSIASLTKKSDCVGCHSGHSSEAKGLLGPYGHAVFFDEKCGSCHNPIQAGKPVTTTIKGKKLCLKCHTQESVAFRQNAAHEAASANPCTLCHNHHASKKKNLTVKESGVCLSCHASAEKSTAMMEKALKSIRCAPIKNRRCFECHIPLHSDLPRYFRAEVVTMCSRCHESQHKITHPVGVSVIDPRTGEPVTCVSCHSMHSAKAEFMLTHDRKRQLCKQCHDNK